MKLSLFPTKSIGIGNVSVTFSTANIGSPAVIFPITGTSMIEAGIHDGDIVIVQKQDTARNGEIVVAMTEDNEVTLKTFYKEDGYFRLQPENSTMDPIILDNVYIVGKAIGLYRKI